MDVMDVGDVGDSLCFSTFSHVDLASQTSILKFSTSHPAEGWVRRARIA